MTNETAIAKGARLDSGMKASEAVALASAWWDKTGRHFAARMSHADPVMAGVSGIIAGHVFEHLTKREKLNVVKVWHHIFVRRPDVLEVDAAAPFKLGGRERVQ